MRACHRRWVTPRPASKSSETPPPRTSVAGPKRSITGGGLPVPKSVTVVGGTGAVQAMAVALGSQKMVRMKARMAVVSPNPRHTHHVLRWSRQMPFPRRALPLLLATPALAQSRPVRMLVPFGAGGISDVVARIVAEPAARALGQPIIIENRPGAGGNIAGEALTRAAPDGQTIMLASSGMFAANPVLYPRMPFDPLRDFEPLALVATSPHVLVTAGPHASLAALLAAARAAPEAMSWSTAGVGSSPHQSMLLLQSLSGTRFLDVHFRSGAEGVQAVLTAQVTATAEAVVVLAEQVRAGTLRALCVAGAARVAQLPEVPTAAEAGLPGFENGSTAGIVAPRGVPPEILARLSEAFMAATRDPGALRRLSDQGSLSLAGGPAEFSAMMARETARWAPLLVGLRAG